MGRMLAVDWDRHEVRYVLATSAGGRLAVRTSGAAPLVDAIEDGEGPRPEVGHSLRAALLREKVGRATTLVGVDRGSIELLHLKLPPAQDAELPELVLNQAMRESSGIGEDTALDFLPLDDDPSRPREVTAAAFSPEELKRIKAACAAAGLRPKRMLLRPYASASLLRRMAPAGERVRLLVNLVGGQLDLTVLVEDRAVFSRTVRLPRSAELRQANRRISAEIRRTVTVATESQTGGQQVESVYIFGGPGEHAALAEQIRHELSLPAVVVNPFEAPGVSADRVPADPACFASLLGMLLDEAEGRGHAVDFLHPRRPPRQTSRGRMIAAVSAVVVAAALAAGYFAHQKFAHIDRTNGELEADVRRLNNLLNSTARDRQVTAAVRRWQAGDVLWLEELRELSLRMPPGQDAVVLRMSMAADRNAGGVIDLKGLVRDPSVLLGMEQALRDEHHHVHGKGVQKSGRQEDYTWHFDTAVSVARRSKTQYVSHLPGTSPEGPPGNPSVAGGATAAREPSPPPGRSRQGGPLR